MLKYLQKILNPLTYVSKGNLPIVALCFFIASSFWFVKALNKRYNSKIRLPVVFKYDKNKIYAKSKLPEKLWVDAHSTGWILLQHKLGLKSDSLVYNIGGFFETSQTIEKEDLIRYINNNVRGVLVNQILERDLSLEFESIKSKKIKLVIDSSSLVFSKGLRLQSCSTSPKRMTITGPNSLLMTVTDNYLLPVHLDSSNKSLVQVYHQKLNFDSSLEVENPNVKIEFVFIKK